jgi:pterin-4a-carbinolamine dehydratase
VADRSDGSLTLRARTESLQAVTEIDLVLAARVDDAVAAVGSGG